MRALLLLLALVACSTTEPVDPDACVPEGGYGCDDLTGDAVMDSLLTYPDSLDPTTGLPWDTLP